MREFRRLTKTYTQITIWTIYIIVAIIIGLEKYKVIFNIPANILQYIIVVWVCVFPAIIIIGYLLPPNFEYYVSVKDNVIIFEFSDDDYRVISTSFNIVKKGIYYILLDDGWARMVIPYNKEVLAFLHKQQKIHS